MTSQLSAKTLLTFSALLVVSVSVDVHGQFSSLVEFTGFRHEYNGDFFRSNQIQLVNYSNHMVLDGCIVFSKAIAKFDVRFEAISPKREWSLLNVTVDGCKFLENKLPKSLTIITSVRDGILSTSPKFPSGCPLEKDREYCFTNFGLNSVSFPAFLPATTLGFNFDLHQKEISIYKVFYEVTIRNK